MLRHASLLAIAVSVLFVGLVGAALYFGERPTTFKVAVGPANGPDARLVQAIANQLASDRTAMRVRVIIKDGAGGSAKALETGESDFAVVRRDLGIPKNGQAIAVVRQDVVFGIVPAEGSLARGGTKPKGGKVKAKKIEKLEDIAGHRIGLISRDSTPSRVLDIVLKQHEIPQDKIRVVLLDPDDVAASLRANPVDAILVIGPVSSQFISDAIMASSTTKEAPGLLAVASAAAIESRWPVYESIEIKAGALGGAKPLPDEDVTTLGFSFYLVARKSLSDQQVGLFTKLLFGLRQNMIAEYPSIAELAKPDTDKDAVVLVHPGAIAYFDGDQKTFFDRYSDQMFWGMMLLSGLGSAITWIAGYFKADDRLRRMHTLQRLLDIVKRARGIETLEGLDNLQIEVEEILQKTIIRAERNEVDETSLATFRLALDQAQRAISERRAILSGVQRMPAVLRADATVLSAANS
jgi:TRAP-type uncharacterized transport system substrate-binding protein